MFDNPLGNDTYVDDFIANNANLIDSNSDIITPSNLEINSLSNAIDSLLMDSLLTAKDLGTVSDKQQLQGNVSPLDRKDFYHFRTDKIGDLDYRLTGLSSGANIQLLDSDGDMLSGSFKPGKANEYKVHHNLPAGDYYLKVYGHLTNYNLDVELLGDPDAMNSFFTAKDFGTLTGKQTQQGTVSKEDRLDLYHFRTDETGDLEYKVTGLSNNANIQLLDSDGDMLSGSFNPGKADEHQVHEDLVAGDYYLKVYGGGTDYNLDFELLADFDAIDSLLTVKEKVQDLREYIVENGDNFLLGLVTQWGRNNGSELILPLTDPTFIQEFEQRANENNWILAGKAVADIISIAQGYAEINAGSSAIGTGVAAAPVSGGTSLVLTAAGTWAVVHGGYVVHEGTTDLAETLTQLGDNLFFESRTYRDAPSDLPVLDGTGKVHGDLPVPENLNRYSDDDLIILRDELEESVQQRIRKNIEFNNKQGDPRERRGHQERQTAEQELIQQINRYLENR